MNFKDLSLKLNNLIDHSQDVCLDFIKQNEEQILDLNKGQIFDGKQSDNVTIDGTYSRFTETVNRGKTFSFNGKSKQKKEGETYFLLDSEKFFDSFSLKTENKAFIIEADTQKPTVNLLEYGKDILGLSEKATNEIAEELVTELANDLNNNYFK